MNILHTKEHYVWKNEFLWNFIHEKGESYLKKDCWPSTINYWNFLREKVKDCKEFPTWVVDNEKIIQVQFIFSISYWCFGPLYSFQNGLNEPFTWRG